MILSLAAACGGDGSNHPDAANADAGPQRYEILYTRFTTRPEIALATLDGTILPVRALDGGIDTAGQTALSPDRQRIAFVMWDEPGAEWVLKAGPLFGAAADDVVLAHDAPDAIPAWSPDGTRIAFVAYTVTGWGVYLVDATGGTPELVASIDDAFVNAPMCVAPQWSADGSELLFSTISGIARYVFAEDAVRPLVPSGSAWLICQPRWSPDGESVAFSWAEADGNQGRIMRIPSAGGTAVRVAGMYGGLDANLVRWSPDGARLAYIDYDPAELGTVLRVVDAAGGTPVPLEVLDAGVAGAHAAWSPDSSTLLFPHHIGDHGELATIPASGGTRTDLGLPADIGGAHQSWVDPAIVR